MKSFYQYLRGLWKKPSDDMLKIRNRKWRKESVVKRVERPTKLHRARALGYKAKQGFVVVRTRIKKGGRTKPKIRKGRRPKRMGRVKYTTKQSLQALAEKRVARKFPNLEVLNSYLVNTAGKEHFFEVILVDPNHPNIRNDPKISWVTKQRKRVFRGLTSAGKKSRRL